GAFLHVAVARAEVTHDSANLAQIRTGFLRRADVRLRHDLHQRHAGAVQVDITLRRMLIVQRLPRILLQMQPRHADLPGGAIGEFDLDLSLADDGVLVLADLIAGREIGIKVVLSVEAAHDVDVRIQAEAGAHRLRYALAVDHRQHAGEGGIDETYLRVWGGTEIRCGAGEQLGAADDLGMDFQADDDLPRPGAAFDRVCHIL